MLPLAAAAGNSAATPGTLAFWGGLDSRTLAGDADNSRLGRHSIRSCIWASTGSSASS